MQFEGRLVSNGGYADGALEGRTREQLKYCPGCIDSVAVGDEFDLFDNHDEESEECWDKFPDAAEFIGDSAPDAPEPASSAVRANRGRRVRNGKRELRFLGSGHSRIPIGPREQQLDEDEDSSVLSLAPDCPDFSLTMTQS